MWQALYKTLELFASGGLASFLVGAGISLTTYAGLDLLVESALSGATSSFTGIPANLAGLLALAGVGDAFEILASALLTRIALVTAMQGAGLSFTKGAPTQ